MKALLLAVLLIAALVMGTAVWADTYTSPTGVIQPGVNYFSLPGLTSNTDPATVFAGIPLDGKLSYWCRMTQEWHVYPTDWTGVPALEWHMGYRLETDESYTFSFTGTQPSTERSTCLNPLTAGLAFISMPYDHQVYWNGFTFGVQQNPGVRYTLAQAVANGWVESYLIEGAPDSGVHVTVDGANNTLKPWQGYWVTSKVGPNLDKLTIYWPTQPVPEPGSLLALGTGLVGLAGFVVRRRKR